MTGCVQERLESAKAQDAGRSGARPRTRGKRGPSIEVGGVRLTPAQQRILGYIAAQTAVGGGACCTKRGIAEMLNYDVKTVDRAISLLRRKNMIEVEMRFLENGGQLPNLYRTTGWALNAVRQSGASRKVG